MMKILRYLALFFMFAVTMVQARFHWIDTDREFLDRINNYQFALVGFVSTRVDGKYDKELSHSVKDLRKVMQAASETSFYKSYLKKDVGFFMLDVSKEFGQDLAEKYKLSDFPQFMLFEQGEAIVDGHGFALRQGFISKADMLDFLDLYFGKAFDEIVDLKKEEERLEREERIARYNYYDRAYGWNPYYGWGPYSYRWGGYVCNGYDCYRRYPRAYVGVGFAV